MRVFTFTPRLTARSRLAWTALVAAVAGLALATARSTGQLSSPPTVSFRPLAAVSSNSFVAAVSNDPSKASALSLAKGEWVTYSAPPGTTLQIVGMNDVAALAMSGPNLKEVVVFDAARGAWSTHPVAFPAGLQEIRPRGVVLGNVVFEVGSRVVVYNLVAGRWDVLDLPAAEAPLVQPSGNAVLVQQGKTLYVYSVPLGLWSKGVDAQAPRGLGPGSRPVTPSAP